MIDIGKISTFPSDSKVWVYYPNQVIDESYINEIKEKLQVFSATWSTHGATVKNYIELLQPHNIIIIIADSQTFPSGCSIDSQVAIIREIELLSSVQYMDRGQMYYLESNQFKSCHIQNMENEINENTMVFNPFFDDLQDWSENFLVLAKNSKYKKMLGY